MKLYYGYDHGKFVLVVTDEQPNPTVLQRISISRNSVNKIFRHMQFGKEGDTRVIEGHEQLIVPEFCAGADGRNLREVAATEAREPNA